jgi:hypothetical protein
MGIKSDTFLTSTFDIGDSPGSRSCHLTAKGRCPNSNYTGSLVGLRADIDLVTNTKVSILLPESNSNIPAHISRLQTERLCLAGIENPRETACHLFCDSLKEL